MAMTIDMQQLETDLRDSTNAYDNILSLLTLIGAELGNATHDELLEMNATLENLQWQATRRDQSILDRLQKLPARSATLEALLKDHGIVVHEVLLQNESVASKAKSVKSLLAHELGTLRNGLTGIKGYSQHGNEQGRIVNRSS